MGVSSRTGHPVPFLVLPEAPRAPFLCTAVYAIFTQRPKIRRLFVIAYVLVAIANIGGCAFEITHAFN